MESRCKSTELPNRHHNAEGFPHAVNNQEVSAQRDRAGAIAAGALRHPPPDSGRAACLRRRVRCATDRRQSPDGRLPACSSSDPRQRRLAGRRRYMRSRLALAATGASPPRETGRQRTGLSVRHGLGWKRLERAGQPGQSQVGPPVAQCALCTESRGAPACLGDPHVGRQAAPGRARPRAAAIARCNLNQMTRRAHHISCRGRAV